MKAKNRSCSIPNSNVSTTTSTEATTTHRHPWCRHHWCKHNRTTTTITTPASIDVYQDYTIGDIYVGDDQFESNDDDFETKDLLEEDEDEDDGDEEPYFIPIEQNEYTTDAPNFYDTFRAVADARK